MYAGHFAVGLALKAKRPAAPTWAILLGTGFLDVLFGIFVMLGIERVTMTPHVGQGFSLDFIDWSHSLVMSLVWSALYGLIFWRKGRAVAFLVAFAVFSHFLFDLPMHPKDLALWPHAATHLGNTPASQDKQLPHNKVCDQCVQGAQLGAALLDTSPDASWIGSPAAQVEQAPVSVHLPRPLRPFSSRAPPVLL